MKEFLIGINYLPQKKGFFFWNNFEHDEIRKDLAIIAEYGFNPVRIFLLWDSFQPTPKKISVNALKSLVDLAEIAYEMELKILPTLFVGHLRGINYLPAWIVKTTTEKSRFPTFVNGELGYYKVYNFFEDREMMNYQKLFVKEVVNALYGHPAIWGWDLGNELSNIVISPTKDSALIWIDKMIEEIKRKDEDHPVTLGLSQTDLEEDRNLGLKEAARLCDIISIHLYPFHISWAKKPLDEKVVLLFALISRWISGKEILIEEIGVPTKPKDITLSIDQKTPIFSEKETEKFYTQTLSLLKKHGFIGTIFWCFGDYDKELWSYPPFNDNINERFFGLFTMDKLPKSYLFAIKDTKREKQDFSQKSIDWIDITLEDFYRSPKKHLIRLYEKMDEVEHLI